MSDGKIDLDLSINVDDAVKEIKKDLEKDLPKAASRGGKKAGENFEKEFDKETKDIGKDLGSNFGAESLAKAAVVIGSVGFAVSKLSGFITSATQAAARQELAVQQLNGALRRTGEFTSRASIEFQDFASDIQNTSVFGDELILEQLAYAKSLGLTNKQVKDVVSAAVELSAALGVDLNSAVRNIAKTFSGLQGELGELLPSLRNLTKEQLQAGQATQLINSQFGGASQTQLKTFSGGVDALTNAFGDFTESIGEYITQSPLVKAAIEGTTSVLKSLTLQIKPTKTLSDQIKILSNDIQDLQSKISDNQAFLEREKIITSQTIAVKNSVKEQIKEIEALRSRLLILRQEQENQEIFGSIDSTIAEQSKKNLDDVKKFSDQEKEARLTALAQIGLSEQQVREDNFAKQRLALENALAANLITEKEFLARGIEQRAQFDAIDEQRRLDNEQKRLNELDRISNGLRSGQLLFDDFTSSLVSQGEVVTKVLSDIAKETKRSLVQGFGRSASSAFAAFGAALANGENALEAFGKAFAQSIGQQAVVLGTKFILEGAAISFSPTSGGPAVGLPLIAKGSALAAFGGFPGAAGGGGGQSAGTAAATGTGAFVDQDSGGASFNQVDLEDRESAQKISLTVNGDVFDSQESGLRILDILENAGFASDARVIS